MMGAGLRPVHIDVEPLAIGRALVDAAGDELADQTVVNVHIGATNTLILIFRQKLLAFVRVIPSAGQNLTQTIAETLMLDEAQAELLKVRLGSVAEGGYEGGREERQPGEDMLAEGEDEFLSDSVFELSTTGEDSATMEPPDEQATHLEIEEVPDLEPPAEGDQVGAAPAGQAEEPAPAVEQDPDLVEAKEQVAGALVNSVLDIATEVRRSLDFYRRQHRNEPIDRIILTGGTANLEGIEDLIAEETGVATERGNPFRHLVADEEQASQRYLADIGPSAVVAVGLALRDMVPD